MKRGTTEHPKFVDLCAELNRPKHAVIGILEGLWHFTAKFAPQGNVGKFSNASIARYLEWDGDAEGLVEALLKCRWLDCGDTDRLLVHDWADHADDSIQMSLARSRQYFCCGRAPNYRRLSAKEREAAHDFYTNAHDMRTESAQKLPAKPRLAPPEPSPATPEPSMRVRSIETATMIGEVAHRMYSLHPKKKNMVLVPTALESEVRLEANPEAKLREIEECHAAWCATQDWNREGGRFIAPLAEWLADKGYTKWPPGHSRNRPAPRALNPYVKPTLPIEEPNEPTPIQPRY